MKQASEPASQPPLLRLDNLTKHFPQITANDCIHLEIARGEVHCLLGENGAGKSTLAECLYGFLTPDSGKIYFKGHEVRLGSPSDAIQLGIGMVHQHFVLVQPLTVLENIIAGVGSTRFFLDLPASEKRLKELANNYDLHLDFNARIWQLSVGEQQWVEILKALYMGVELLILDEPTAVLTPQEAEKLFTILRRMKQQGLSILFITHKLKEVMSVSDRVSVLRKGRLVSTVQTADITPQDLARLMVGREVVFKVEKEEINPGPPILEIHGLHAMNDKGQEAVCGIDLVVRQNQVIGIAGVSGNGQKELFEVLVGVRPATQGKILLAGEEITRHTPREIARMGLAQVPEDRLEEGLVPDFTIEENLILGLQHEQRFKQKGLMDFKKIRAFAQECIQQFEIAARSPLQTTRTLSGGNLQKVILAREFSARPRCLIANQTTRGLDVGATEYVHRRLLEQRQQGVGIILISEDLDEILSLSDHIVVFFKGEIIGQFAQADADIQSIGLLMAGVREGT